MNFYTLAAKLNKAIDKDIALHKSVGALTDEQIRTMAERVHMADFERNMRVGIRLMKRFKEIAQEEGLYDTTTRHYFITVRPNPKTVDFDDFYDKVLAYTRRNCVLDFTLTFEQKGECEADLGKGFHIHMIADMTQRSKGEVLRDTQSTFTGMAAKNAIEVSIVKTDADMKRVRGYIIDYASKDGHKLKTLEWDTMWRAQRQLAPIYTNSLPIKSSRQAVLIEPIED